MPHGGFGHRGELYVVAQFLLLLLVIAGPVTIGGWPGHLPPGPLLDAITIGSAAAGMTLLLAGTRRLGRNLTPLPYPKIAGSIASSGIPSTVG